jgi:hypothetical protein
MLALVTDVHSLSCIGFLIGTELLQNLSAALILF